MENACPSRKVVLSLWLVFVVMGLTASNASAQEGFDPAAQEFDPAAQAVDPVAPAVDPAAPAVQPAGPTVEVEIRSAPPEPGPTSTPRPTTWASDEEFPDALEPEEEDGPSVFLHGFRLGYLYVMNSDTPLDSTDPESPTFAEQYDLRSPHQFVVGYEVTWRMAGHDWLNVLLVGNVLVSGLEQSRFFPTANGLLGFEFAEAFQVGVGVNFAPTRIKPAHMLLAAGWTPRIGNFYVPLHVFFVPDVDGQHRTGITLGVNWD